MNTRPILTAIAAGLICAQPLFAQTPKPPVKPGAAPAARPAGPWAKVPALPTACYSGQDQNTARDEAAREALRNEHQAQVDINDAIRQNSIDNRDPMAMAARMQQKLMDDPANARKYMEMMSGKQAQEEAPAQLEKEQQFEAESDALIKQYQAALDKARAAGNARLEALRKRLEVPPSAGIGFALAGDPGEPAWVQPERRAIFQDWDRGYAATCPQWWSATGPIHAYLKRYKDFLVLERTPHEKEFGDKPRLENYKMFDVDTTGWRTTTDYEAAADYMNMAAKLFDKREAEPWCQQPYRCQ